MIDYQTISVVFTGISLSLAAFYYINTLRNAQRTQQLTLETRQAQMFMGLYQRTITEDANRRWSEYMTLTWTDYDDFDRKYGQNSPDRFVKAHTLLQQFNGIGLLLMDGLISREMAYRLAGGWRAVLLWLKWGPIVKELRERYDNPDYMDGLEYLGEEMMKYREEKGLPNRLPEPFQSKM